MPQPAAAVRESATVVAFACNSRRSSPQPLQLRGLTLSASCDGRRRFSSRKTHKSLPFSFYAKSLFQVFIMLITLRVHDAWFIATWIEQDLLFSDFPSAFIYIFCCLASFSVALSSPQKDSRILMWLTKQLTGRDGAVYWAGLGCSSKPRTAGLMGLSGRGSGSSSMALLSHCRFCGYLHMISVYPELP
ncbi:hypothetical protein AAHA92_12337 [Salvia divinorum]|uniref:Uncharacterized protein n=1 Tax=Salvia divinorum TaxID=28513 RepID=A0ABD1HKC3_SALDI